MIKYSLLNKRTNEKTDFENINTLGDIRYILAKANASINLGNIDILLNDGEDIVNIGNGNIAKIEICRVFGINRKDLNIGDISIKVTASAKPVEYHSSFDTDTFQYYTPTEKKLTFKGVSYGTERLW